MTQQANPDLEALEALITHPGWKLWCDWYESEWGASAFAKKVAVAVGNPDIDPQKAVTILQQTTVALKAVEALKEWPMRRIQALKRQHLPQEVNLSRRGPGL